MKRFKQQIFWLGCTLGLGVVWLGVMWAAGNTAPNCGANTPSVPSCSSAELVYSTYFGAEFSEYGYGVAVDDEGNRYLTGLTNSMTFPTPTLGLQAPEHGIDTFVAKLSADGQTLEYVFWFYATSDFSPDQGYSIAVDSEGGAYVTGETSSFDFCDVYGDVPGYDQLYGSNGTNGNNDTFVLKVKPDGSGLEYCTFIGGSDWDVGRAITVDEAGNAYVVGGTWSADLATTEGAIAETLAGARDAYVVKLDPTGTQLLYGSYLGGTGQDEARAVTVNPAGELFITGWTFSADFPTTLGSYDPTQNGGVDAFALKLDPIKSELLYSTFIGSSEEDRANALVVSPAGELFVAGYTQSPNFPTTPLAFDTSYNAGHDGFIVGLDPAGANLTYGTFVGGSLPEPLLASDQIHALTLDSLGQLIAAGETRASDFPVTSNAIRSTLSGPSDSFIIQLDPAGQNARFATYFGGSAEDSAYALSINGANLHLFGKTQSDDFPLSANPYSSTNSGEYDAFLTELTLPLNPLTAGFHASPITGTAPLTVTFTNSSSGEYTHLLWDFGNGYTSTITNPVHLYPDPGSYTVTLTISNSLQTAQAHAVMTVQAVHFPAFLPLLFRPE